MNKGLIILTLTATAFCPCRQNGKSTPNKPTIDLKTVDSMTVKGHRKDFLSKKDERQYNVTESKGIIIQNSLPKGGGYTDPMGKDFGYRVFWTRIINKNDTPLELTIKFPANSLAILASPDSYLKLFLPPDTMTIDKESEYDYGATNLKSFLDNGFNKPTMLQKTIKPEEESLFYIGALLYQVNGVVRAGLVLKWHDLFYRISIAPQLDSMLIPCGQIVFKKLRK